MSIDNFDELKLNIFKAIEDQMSLVDFEMWLYQTSELHNKLNEDWVLEVYSINYNRIDARYLLKDILLRFLDVNDFILWKVKSNLLDLIEGKNDPNRILHDLYSLGNDGYDFLVSIGYYLYRIEDIEYTGGSIDELLKDLKDECAWLLNEIVRQELNNINFKLLDFEDPRLTVVSPLIIKKKWWRFWR